MTKVSVIIVSYNVKKFLQLCIESLHKSSIQCEIIVVDNQSKDGTVEFFEANNTGVQFIPLDVNVGFAKGCNKGLEVATGEYILFLNPDTIIQEDTIATCIDFYNRVERPGIVGVKMIDGAGQFLAESKRGFPDPLSSFWKLSGISSWFPKSKFFNQYNLGHLSQNENHPVDVLCGAFMFVRKHILDEVGTFDEDYFMYGEDIDLSYQIQKAGYQNYYLADTSIIHYKGQSTKKQKLKYVHHFYKAMSIFVEKNIAGNKATIYLVLLSVAIQLRKFLSIIKRLFGWLIWPVVEFLIFVAGMIGIKSLWARYYFNDPNYYLDSHIEWHFVGYGIIWVLSLGWNQFDRNKKLLAGGVIRSILIGLGLILVVYAILPDSIRTSRAIVMISSIWVWISATIIRTFQGVLSSSGKNNGPKKIGIVASTKSFDEFEKMLVDKDSGSKRMIHIDQNDIQNLDDVISIHGLHEIVFSINDVDLSSILDKMTHIDDVEFKIFGNESLAAVGSTAQNVPGELYTYQLEYTILHTRNKIAKRGLDILCSLLIFLISPLLSFFVTSSFSTLIVNAFKLALGKITVLGYNQLDPKRDILPPIKSSWLQLHSQLTNPSVDVIHQVNTDYALHYRLSIDIRNILTTWKKL